VPEIDGLLEGGVPIVFEGHYVAPSASRASSRRKMRKLQKAGIAALTA
jgi:hypothetical protein